MKFGLIFANTMGFATPHGAAELARASEAAGVESVWTVEHVVYPDGYESRYPYDPSGKMAMEADTPLPDGFLPGEGDLDELLSVMRASAEEADRDPDEIEVSAIDLGVWGEDPLAAVERMAAKGVHRIAIPAFLFAMAPEPATAIAEFGERVIAPSADL